MEETKQPRSMGSSSGHNSSDSDAGDHAMTVLASVLVLQELADKWFDYRLTISYSRHIAKLLTDGSGRIWDHDEYTCLLSEQQMVWLNLMGFTVRESRVHYSNEQ